MEPNNKNRNFNKGREICFELKKTRSENYRFTRKVYGQVVARNGLKLCSMWQFVLTCYALLVQYVTKEFLSQVSNEGL